MQNDEKIVLSGYSNTGADDHATLVPFNADGMLDQTFGTYPAASYRVRPHLRGYQIRSELAF